MILPVTQSMRFSKLLDLVTLYAHRMLHVVSDDEFFCDDPQHGMSEDGQRETLLEVWEQPQLLEDFVHANPFNLGKRDLAIVESWQHCLTHTFLVSPLPGGRRGEMAFYCESYAIVVYGNSVPITSMLTCVPAVVYTTLLPFEDKIVYAMFMAQYPMDLSENMCSTLQDELEKAVQEGRVLRTGAQLIDALPTIRQKAQERDLKEFRHSMEMEERAAGPLEGQHRGVLADLSEEERRRVVREYSRAVMQEEIKSDSERSLADVLGERCVAGEPRYTQKELLSIDVPDEDSFDYYDEEDEEYWYGFSDPQCLEEDLRYAGERQLECLRELVKRGGRWHIAAEEISSLAPYPSPSRGLCYYFRENDGFVAIMPNEVVAAARDVDWDALLSYARERRRMLHFFDAVEDLRGMVPLEQAIDEYQAMFPNGFKDRQQIADIVFDSLDSVEFGGCMLQTPQQTYLIHYELLWEHRREAGRDAFEEGAFERGDLGRLLKGLLAQQRGKDPRPITQEMLDSDAVFLWVGEQPPARALRNYLDAHVPDECDDYFFAEKVIEDLLTEVFWGQTQGSVQAFFDILEHNGFVPDESQLNTLVNLWTNMCNGLPNWPNNGWSPNELMGRMSRRRMFFNEDGSVMKVGRNDPCPCGSGKKYKRCCGR